MMSAVFPLGVFDARRALPIIPGLDVHQRLGGENLDLIVVRKARRDFHHRLGIGGVEGEPVGFRIVRVAGGERRDQRLLLGARLGAPPWPLAIAAKAGATASGDIGALMFGPRTRASPQ